jgi:hypothetical protein
MFLRSNLALACLLLACCASLAAEPDKLQKKKPFEMVVVRTWGDLFDQPLLTLSDGSKARVGFEAKEVPAHSVFLVYVLINGGKYNFFLGEESLGPLRLEVTRPGKRRELLVEEARVLRTVDASNKIKHLLFATTAFVCEADKYELTLKRRDGVVMAQAFVNVTNKESTPWLSFGLPEAREQEKLRGKDEPVRASFSVTHRAGAWPRCHGYIPIMTRPDHDKEIPLTQGLPYWRFDEPDSRLTLSASQRSLSLHSSFAMYLSYPRNQFLYRLWINDRLIPPSTERCEAEKQRALEAVLCNKVCIDWDFDPKVIGAKKGDRVAVQVLYCPDGWRDCDDRERRRTKDIDILKAGQRVPVLSTKSEFRVR